VDRAVEPEGEDARQARGGPAHGHADLFRVWKGCGEKAELALKLVKLGVKYCVREIVMFCL
jgi:hypothetical protein